LENVEAGDDDRDEGEGNEEEGILVPMLGHDVCFFA